MDVPLLSPAGKREEKPRVGERYCIHLSEISRNSGDDNKQSWSSLNKQIDTSNLIENRTSVSMIQHESSQFSSSLSDIFSRKLRLEHNLQHACKVAAHHEEEPFAHLEDLGRQTIGNLLPDEDDFFCGATDGLGLNTKANKGDEMEDFDLFSSVGGMELEGDDHLCADQRNANPLDVVSDIEGVFNSSTDGQHPCGGHPSRTLFVRNIDSHVKDSELKDLFEKYGDIRSLYTTCKHCGFVMISYYDIRAAQNAMRALQNEPLRCRKLDIHYSIPKGNPSEKDINHGTLLVSNLDHSVLTDELQQIFGVFGEIKEIYRIPQKDNDIRVEYYDVRATEAALCALKQIDISGKQIKLELSHPGVVSLVSPMGQEEDETTIFESTMTGKTPGHKVASACMDNGYPRHFNTVVGSPMSSVIEPHRSSSAPISLLPQATASLVSIQSSLNEQNQCLDCTKLGNQPFPSLHPHSIQECPDMLTYGFPCNSLSTITDIAGSIGIRMTEGSSHIWGVKPNTNLMEGTCGVLGPFGNGSHPMQPNTCIWSNSSPCQQHPSNTMLWRSSSSFVNRTLADHLMHMNAFPSASAILHARSGIHHIGSAPLVSSPFWDGQHTYAGGSPDVSSFDLGSLGSMVFPGSSPLHSAELASRNFFSHLRGNCMDMAKNGVVHAPQQICHLFPVRNPMISVPASFDSPNDRLRNFSHRRNEVNLNSADKKQFELNIDRIIREEDIRTTLMIKNIPNKYTSKMLLAAIDEHCRGTYDFIYLPIDFKNKCNVGYAFINMIDPQQIIPFYKAFNGKRWEKFNSEKVASLAYARIQGKAALIAHFQNSSLMNEDKRCRPILFHTDGPNAGDQEPFPVSTNIRTRPGRSQTNLDEVNHQTGFSTSANGLECFAGTESSLGSFCV